MKRILSLSLVLLALLALACAASTPLKRLKRDLSKYPEYSVILQDMREDGNFFKDYFHRYKIVYAESAGIADSLSYNSELTDWYEVDKKEYQKYGQFLGMVIASKTKDGGVSDTQYPPGYQYVGNERYGQWRRDDRGNSFWEFYGKYAFFSHMFGMFNRPIYRNDYGDYRRYSSSGRPYFGRNREYGTRGSNTRHTNKSFFDRQKRKEAARKSAFSQKVKQRTRRSRTSGVRRRSGGFGK